MKSKKKRKRQSPWPLLAALAALGIALWLLLANVIFVVRNVQVVGAGEIPTTDVLRLSGIRLGRPMSAVREEDVHFAVESNGQVAFVGLEKRYPNSVVLTVRPRSHDALMLQGAPETAVELWSGREEKIGAVLSADLQPHDAAVYWLPGEN